MKEILEKLFTNSTLSKEQAKSLFKSILSSEANQFQIAAVLTCFRMRAITIDELIGFREAALEDCIKIDMGDYEAIDVCGTGGDNKNTFNISTISALVIAACGVRVVKHGGGAVSSKVGSSNLLESAGLKFTNDISKLKKQIEKTGICFLHAPLFHPSFKNVANIRKELGIKTFFNLLGPVLNPTQPKFQILGVYSLELVKLYRYLSQKLDKDYTIVHTLDGCDEISLTGVAIVSDRYCEKILNPSDFGLEQLSYPDIYSGNSLDSSLKIFQGLMENTATKAQKDVVAANAGLALYQYHVRKNPNVLLIDCVKQAGEALESGKVKSIFNMLRDLAGN